MSRRPVIFGNWKMNMLRKDAAEFFEETESFLSDSDEADFGLAVPYTCLDVCRKAAIRLKLAAENCHEADHGAFTGEISIPMLAEIGIEYCVIGHSERRTFYAETDEACARKAKALLAAEIIPILCVGETEAQYDSGETLEVLRYQLEGSLADLSGEEVSRMVIAYEPVWAIGTGKSADQTIAQNCCHAIREIIKERYGDGTAEAVRIQYGGSVKPENIREYMNCADIDGALIGGASLKAESFKKIIAAVCR